jgi:hypothetical protein
MKPMDGFKEFSCEAGLLGEIEFNFMQVTSQKCNARKTLNLL